MALRTEFRDGLITYQMKLPCYYRREKWLSTTILQTFDKIFVVYEEVSF